MKIAVLGAGGVRTPLLVEAMVQRRLRLGLTELALMDIDEDRLSSIAALLPGAGEAGFRIHVTTGGRSALEGADYVITTFRVGGLAARILDERIPLRHGVLGQETTGPGGFAMAMRTIPVLLDYIGQMREVCPAAWLVNFANPAGLLAQAATTVGGWPRTVGICDAPAGIARVAAAVLRTSVEKIDLDYFGLNHLGWVRAIRHGGVDQLPRLIGMLQEIGELPGLPFPARFLARLGMIPNEYMVYYYRSRTVVENLLRQDRTRGEEIAGLNDELFTALAQNRAAGDVPAMRRLYHEYLTRRGETYMAGETGGHDLSRLDPALVEALGGEGYAGVALDLIEGLERGGRGAMVLNVPNRGAVGGMAADDVVEAPSQVSSGAVRPLAVGAIPPASLGLMLQVKAYERLTVEAAVEGSEAKAQLALSLHPLVGDERLARVILDEYRAAHAKWWPALS